MNRALLALIGVVLLAAPVRARAQVCPNGAPVAFVAADVLTMNDSTPLRGVTVLVRAGVIEAVGDDPIPANACRIDARGKTLLPGLADMHVHTEERELPIFLFNGVTTVREMNGSPEHVALRERVARGELLGPRLLVTSPLLSGIPLLYRHKVIKNADDAYAAAHEAKAAGYDFLKIYDDLSRESYEALVTAGNALGLRLDGHVPAAVGLEAVIEAGQSIQHMDKIVFALAGHTGDTTKLAELPRLFGGRANWVTPTLASLRALDLSGTPEYAARLRSPEMAYADSGTLDYWGSLRGSGTRAYKESSYLAMQKTALARLREMGVRMTLGTDAANPLMLPGFSVHDELEALVIHGGFSPYEALLTATRNAADFVGDARSGRVAPGARADLLMVDSNPLAGLAVLRDPSGVMVNGRWLDRAALSELRAKSRLR
jgi:imidazolonepropionase-like amidohydrolase